MKRDAPARMWEPFGSTAAPTRTTLFSVSIAESANADLRGSKSGRISDSQFYAWSEQAREQKKKCDDGIITVEEFRRWLKES